jgi:hypothetical protein
MKCLFKRNPFLYELLLSNQERLYQIVNYVNSESSLAVKYSAKICLPMLSNQASLPVLLGFNIAERLQQSIALSSVMVNYLMRDVAAMCETSADGCLAMIQLGLFESEKLTVFSLQSAVAMLRAYLAAAHYQILEIDERSAPQIRGNIEFCLENDDVSVLLLTLRVIAAVVPLGVALDDLETLLECQWHENQEIANLATGICGGLCPDYT